MYGTSRGTVAAAGEAHGQGEAQVRYHRSPAAALAALSVLSLLAGCDSARDEDQATKTARGFLAAWAAGDAARAASFTDAPTIAQTELKSLTTALRINKTQLSAGDKRKGRDDDTAWLSFRVSLTLTGAGTWRYPSTLQLRRSDKTWKVHCTPSVLYPKLRSGTHLVRYRQVPARAGLLAADGSELAPRGTVWAISIWPAKLTDPDRAYQALHDPDLGVDIDTNALKARVRQADANQSVPVVTVRDAVYRKVRERLLPIAGLQFHDFARPLATGAKELLGSVAPATVETLRNAGPDAVAADEVGASGLQFRYQKELAGKPGIAIRIVDKQTQRSLGEVYQGRPTPGTPVRTTLDPRIQRAADAALAGLRKTGSLVALRPSTGEVLAVANTERSGDNRAFVGRYPPGSTFKVVTAAALLQAGVSPDTPAPCPRTVNVNGQRFENQAEFELPQGTTFREDFAQSCNTGIIGLRDKLSNQALGDAAGQFGIDGEWQVGASSFDGSVPTPVT